MIAARGKHLKKRREDTRVPVSASAWRTKRDADDAALDALDPKLDEQPQRFEVSVVEYGPPKPPPEAGARALTSERIDMWRESLARDPWVAESLQLLHDMVKANTAAAAPGP